MAKILCIYEENMATVAIIKNAFLKLFEGEEIQCVLKKKQRRDTGGFKFCRLHNSDSAA